MADDASHFPAADDAEDQARAWVGKVLCGKWRLDQLLGMGGMGIVYAATHRNGHRVAVKVLRPEWSRQADVRERFLAEGYVANRIGHPATVDVIDDDVTADGMVFLVLDLLEGETVDAKWNRQGRIALGEAAEIAVQVLDLLEAAHAKGIVHRDIKPENVFLTATGEVRVLDFGIAAVRDAQRARTTQAGRAMGTPAYMSPEQARGRWEEVDARADLWSLGATLFALVSGRLVHEAETENELLLSAMTVAAPAVRSVAPEVPFDVAEVIDRSLKFDRQSRYLDARAMRQALVDACRNAGVARVLPRSIASSLRVSSLLPPPESTAPFVLSQSGSAPRSGPTLAERGSGRRARGAALSAALGFAVVTATIWGLRSRGASPPAVGSSSASSATATSAAGAPASLEAPTAHALPSSSEAVPAVPAAEAPVDKSSEAAHEASPRAAEGRHRTDRNGGSLRPPAPAASARPPAPPAQSSAPIPALAAPFTSAQAPSPVGAIPSPEEQRPIDPLARRK